MNTVIRKRAILAVFFAFFAWPLQAATAPTRPSFSDSTRSGTRLLGKVALFWTTAAATVGLSACAAYFGIKIPYHGFRYLAGAHDAASDARNAFASAAACGIGSLGSYFASKRLYAQIDRESGGRVSRFVGGVGALVSRVRPVA